MCWQGCVPPKVTMNPAEECTKLSRLRELEGYHFKFVYDARDPNGGGGPETCWACGRTTARAMAVVRQVSGNQYLAPLCMNCYGIFQDIHKLDLVAWELMRE